MYTFKVTIYIELRGNRTLTRQITLFSLILLVKINKDL
jgi:hypothetical protein